MNFLMMDALLASDNVCTSLKHFVENKPATTPVCSKSSIDGLEKLIGKAITCGTLTEKNIEEAQLVLRTLLCLSSYDEQADGLSVLLQYGLAKMMSSIFHKALEVVRGTDAPIIIKFYDDVLEVISVIADYSQDAKLLMVQTFCDKFIIVVMSNELQFVSRLETLKTLNIVLEGCSLVIREKLKKCSGYKQLIDGLSDLIVTAGDYEFQVGIVETLFRLVTKTERVYLANQWFLETCVSKAFLAIRDSFFETDCRQFLNILNKQSDNSNSVVSLPCQSVSLGNYKLCKPDDPNYTEFWVDFNTGSRRISLFCHPESELTQEDDETMWETVSIWENSVNKYACSNSGDTSHIVIELNHSARELIGFGPPFKDSMVSFCFLSNLNVNNPLRKTLRNVGCTKGKAKTQRKVSSNVQPVFINYKNIQLPPNNNSNEKACSQQSQQSVTSTPKPRRHVSVPIDRVTTPTHVVISSPLQRVDTPALDPHKLREGRLAPKEKPAAVSTAIAPKTPTGKGVKTVKRVKTPIQLVSSGTVKEPMKEPKAPIQRETKKKKKKKVSVAKIISFSSTRDKNENDDKDIIPSSIPEEQLVVVPDSQPIPCIHLPGVEQSSKLKDRLNQSSNDSGLCLETTVNEQASIEDVTEQRQSLMNKLSAADFKKYPKNTHKVSITPLLSTVKEEESSSRKSQSSTIKIPLLQSITEATVIGHVIDVNVKRLQQNKKDVRMMSPDSTSQPQVPSAELSPLSEVFNKTGLDKRKKPADNSQNKETQDDTQSTRRTRKSSRKVAEKVSSSDDTITRCEVLKTAELVANKSTTMEVQKNKPTDTQQRRAKNPTTRGKKRKKGQQLDTQCDGTRIKDDLHLHVEDVVNDEDLVSTESKKVKERKVKNSAPYDIIIDQDKENSATKEIDKHAFAGDVLNTKSCNGKHTAKEDEFQRKAKVAKKSKQNEKDQQNDNRSLTDKHLIEDTPEFVNETQSVNGSQDILANSDESIKNSLRSRAKSIHSKHTTKQIYTKERLLNSELDSLANAKDQTTNESADNEIPKTSQIKQQANKTLNKIEQEHHYHGARNDPDFDNFVKAIQQRSVTKKKVNILFDTSDVIHDSNPLTAPEAPKFFKARSKERGGTGNSFSSDRDNHNNSSRVQGKAIDKQFEFEGSDDEDELTKSGEEINQKSFCHVHVEHSKKGKRNKRAKQNDRTLVKIRDKLQTASEESCKKAIENNFGFDEGAKESDDRLSEDGEIYADDANKQRIYKRTADSMKKNVKEVASGGKERSKYGIGKSNNNNNISTSTQLSKKQKEKPHKCSRKEEENSKTIKLRPTANTSPHDSSEPVSNFALLCKGLVAESNSNFRTRNRLQTKVINYKDISDREIEKTPKVTFASNAEIHPADHYALEKDIKKTPSKRKKRAVFSETDETADSRSEVSWLASTGRRKKPKLQKTYRGNRALSKVRATYKVTPSPLADRAAHVPKKQPFKAQQTKRKINSTPLTEDDEAEELCYQPQKKQLNAEEKENHQRYKQMEIKSNNVSSPPSVLSSICKQNKQSTGRQTCDSRSGRSLPLNSHIKKTPVIPKFALENLSGSIEQQRFDELAGDTPQVPLDSPPIVCTPAFVDPQLDSEDDEEEEEEEEGMQAMTPCSRISQLSSLKISCDDDDNDQESDEDELDDLNEAVHLPNELLSGPSQHSRSRLNITTTQLTPSPKADISGNESNEENQSCGATIQPRRLFQSTEKPLLTRKHKKDGDEEIGAEEEDEQENGVEELVDVASVSQSEATTFSHDDDDDGLQSGISAMIKTFGSDIKQNFSAKRQHLTHFTKATLNAVSKDISVVWDKHQNSRQTLLEDFQNMLVQEITNLDKNIMKTKAAEEKAVAAFKEQHEIMKNCRQYQERRMKYIQSKELNFIQNMKQLDGTNSGVQDSVRGILKKEIIKLQKRILNESQQQEMLSVKRSLQTFFT